MVPTATACTASAQPNNTCPGRFLLDLAAEFLLRRFVGPHRFRRLHFWVNCRICAGFAARSPSVPPERSGARRTSSMDRVVRSPNRRGSGHASACVRAPARTPRRVRVPTECRGARFGKTDEVWRNVGVAWLYGRIIRTDYTDGLYGRIVRTDYRTDCTDGASRRSI